MNKRQAYFISTAFFGVFLFFVPVRAAIVVNEIAAFESSGCEWVELYNTGPDAVSMEGWKFWEQNTNHGISVSASSTQADWTVEPGEYAVIAQNDLALVSGACIGYGAPAGTLFDSSWGSLNESGEPVGLKDAAGNFIEQFTYVAAPDFSLERKDASLADYASANWMEHASGQSFGRQNDASVSSPPPPPPPPSEPQAPPPPPSTGASGPPVQLAQRMVINEFVSDPNTGEGEWVELYNTEDISGDLGGWILRDGVQEIASLSGVIAAHGFLAIEISGSKLNNGGDAVQLESPTRGVVDRVSFGDWSDGEDANVSDNATAPKKGNAIARLIDGYDTGIDSNNFLETLAPTKGSANRIVAPSDPVIAPPPSAPTVASGSQHELYAGPPLVEPFMPPPPPIAHISSVPQSIIEEKPKEPVKKQKETKQKETKKKAPPSRASREGIVSVEPGVLGAQYFYIAFPSSTAEDLAGMQVYLNNKDFPELARGTVVRVVGVLGTAYGEARLKLASRADIEVLSHIEDIVPMALSLSDIPPSAEGGVVEAEGEVTEAKRGFFYLDDGEGEIQVTIRERTGIDAAPAAGERILVRGILHRRGGDEWEILVREAADMERIEMAPAATVAGTLHESKKGIFAVAAGGVASFLLGLLARTRGAFFVGGLKRFWGRKSGQDTVDKEEIL